MSVASNPKATRATLPKVSQKRASRPLDLVHSDVCGPLNPPTPGGNRYIVTFIDDYSRYTVTYLMQHTKEVLDKLQDYIINTSKKFQRKPLILWSDNGGEFTGCKIQEYLKQNGIEHKNTGPDPQKGYAGVSADTPSYPCFYICD